MADLGCTAPGCGGLVVDGEFDAVVIGGGHNGLVAAGYLARAGLKVGVFERRAFVGGASITEELIPGYRFSTCAMTCYALHPRIVQDLEMHRHGFEVFRLEPIELRPFPDGRHLLIWADPERTAREIRRYSEHDADALPAWNAFLEQAGSIVAPFRLRTPPTLGELFASVRGTPREPILERLVTTGYASLLDEFFDSDVVKAAFVHSGDVGEPRAVGTSYPTANMAGGSGDALPELGNIIGLVRGGMGGVTQSLARSAEAQGVEIRTSSEVRRVTVEGGRATGVELADGSRVRARVVLSNADPKRTFLGLVEAEHLPGEYVAAVRRLRTSVAYVKLHLALRELPDFSAYLGSGFDPRAVARVLINPSVAYWETAWREARRGHFSSRPAMSTHIATVYDPSMAPPGHHAMSMFAMYGPVHPVDGTWDEIGPAAAETIIDTFAEYAPNFRRAIVDWRLWTPLDQERTVGLTDGNIHHLDMIPSQLFASRPLPGWADYRTPIEGLWLCGAGTHPGGEVSGMPGHNAAQEVLKTWPARG